MIREQSAGGREKVPRRTEYRHPDRLGDWLERANRREGMAGKVVGE